MTNEDQLAIIKRRLNIVDDKQDDLIMDIITDAQDYFKLLTGASEVDEKYAFIIRNVALSLYNRKGSENITSETVDGYSVSYAQDLFGEYMDIIERDFGQKRKNRRSVARFI